MGARLHNQQGMALLTVLFMVMVIGLMLGLAGQSWSNLMQREREDELLFRGGQYRRAIQSYFEKSPGIGAYPSDLTMLLEDNRFPSKVRHLRQLWPDPFTGEEFELILDPAKKIKGVRSRSSLKPFKVDGFPEEYKTFKDAESYAKWEFLFEPTTAATGAKPAGQPSD